VPELAVAALAPGVHVPRLGDAGCRLAPDEDLAHVALDFGTFVRRELVDEAEVSQLLVDDVRVAELAVLAVPTGVNLRQCCVGAKDREYTAMKARHTSPCDVSMSVFQPPSAMEVTSTASRLST
jgi:hypothetical protein